MIDTADYFSWQEVHAGRRDIRYAPEGVSLEDAVAAAFVASSILGTSVCLNYEYRDYWVYKAESFTGALRRICDNRDWYDDQDWYEDIKAK